MVGWSITIWKSNLPSRSSAASNCVATSSLIVERAKTTHRRSRSAWRRGSIPALRKGLSLWLLVSAGLGWPRALLLVPGGARRQDGRILRPPLRASENWRYEFLLQGERQPLVACGVADA